MSYADARDLAFFVVNFSLSKSQFNEFTDLEKMFIYKAYESKLINDSEYARNAHLNAIQNSKRKKSAKFIDLHKKKQQKADTEYNKDAMSTILGVEEKEGKSWVEKIYAGIGRKPPRKKGE